MRDRLQKSIALALTVSVLVLLKPTEMTAQTQDAIESAKANAPATALKTPWGEPDLGPVHNQLSQNCHSLRRLS